MGGVVQVGHPNFLSKCFLVQLPPDWIYFSRACILSRSVRRPAGTQEFTRTREVDHTQNPCVSFLRILVVLVRYDLARAVVRSQTWS